MINGIGKNVINNTGARTARNAKKSSGKVAADSFTPSKKSSEKEMKDLVSDFSAAIFDKKKRYRLKTGLASKTPPTVEVKGDAVITKSRVMTEGNCNCTLKIPMPEDSGNVLVLPFLNWGGRDYGMPVLYNYDQGVLGAAPHITFSESPQGMGYAQTPDKKRTYIFNTNTSKIKVLDDKLQARKEIDTQKLDSRAERMKKFAAGKNALYAFASPDKLSSDTGIFMAIDKDSGELLWKKELDSVFVNDIKETPDGNVALTMGLWADDDNKMLIFRPDGKKKSEIKLPIGPNDVEFIDNDHAAVCFGGKYDERYATVLDLSKAGKKSSAKKLKTWEVREKELRDIQFSTDRKHVFMEDEKSGFARSHGILKVDAKTGDVAWKREKYGENLIKYRVVDDEVFILSADDKKENIIMTRVDKQGKDAWQLSIPGQIDEYEIGKLNAVNEKGEFLFVTTEGDLHHVRPKKAGETAIGVEKSMSDLRVETRKNQAMESIDENRKAEEEKPGIKEADDYIEIDGIRLDVRKFDMITRPS